MKGVADTSTSKPMRSSDCGHPCLRKHGVKLNEYTTLLCRYNIFADLCTVYTFYFEVKLYKYLVLRWQECWGVFYKRDVVVWFGGLIFRIGITLMAKYMKLRLADMLARETGRLRTTEAVLRLQIKETKWKQYGCYEGTALWPWDHVVGWVLQPDGVRCLSGATCVCGETFSWPPGSSINIL